jgi:RimJ/RimL family protein N-acetyltransferase
MSEARTYSSIETLRNGLRLEIRALEASDRENFIEAVGRSSPGSIYRRFFSPKREFTESEKSFFLNIDFVNHVALVALVEESGRPVIVGGARYIHTTPTEAEIAFTVIDQYQGQGIGRALLHHLSAIARSTGVRAFTAQVLADNAQMLKVFQNSGFSFTSKLESGVAHVTIKL